VEYRSGRIDIDGRICWTLQLFEIELFVAECEKNRITFYRAMLRSTQSSVLPWKVVRSSVRQILRVAYFSNTIIFRVWVWLLATLIWVAFYLAVLLLYGRTVHDDRFFQTCLYLVFSFQQTLLWSREFVYWFVIYVHYDTPSLSFCGHSNNCVIQATLKFDDDDDNNSFSKFLIFKADFHELWHICPASVSNFANLTCEWSRSRTM